LVATFWLAAVQSVVPRAGWAHGLHGHVHVTGWAIENLPAGELRDFFADPDLFRAALSGAMFPDTGYALDKPAAREYGEYSHWEPFIERFIQHVRSTHGPTYDTKEEKLLIAFLLGCASHGLQDELFDSTFLYEVEQRDGPGQEIADPATDGFLVLDGYFRMLPGDYFPIDEVLPLYEVLNQPIDRTLIEDQIRTVRNAYVNDSLGVQFAASYGTRNRHRIPWGSDNYLDPGVPGSLAAEVVPTMRHMEALWERLHGRFDEANLVVHAWPAAPRRLRSANHQEVASWITLVFGKGVEQDSATAALIDGLGSAHPFRLRYTRWGGTSRLIRLQPSENLQPGGFYTARLDPGARLVDGSVTTVAHEHSFQVECDSDQDPECPPVLVVGDPIIAKAVATPTHTAPPAPTSTPTLSLPPTRSPTVSPQPTRTHTQLPSATVTLTPTPLASHTPLPSATAPPTVTPPPTGTASAPPSPTTSAHGDSGCSISAPVGSRRPVWVPLFLALLCRSTRRRARSSGASISRAR
jgi:hypothetical protein